MSPAYGFSDNTVEIWHCQEVRNTINVRGHSNKIGEDSIYPTGLWKHAVCD